MHSQICSVLAVALVHPGISALIGAVVGAGGVGVVSILALRAMNEWKSKSEPETDTDNDHQQDSIDD